MVDMVVVVTVEDAEDVVVFREVVVLEVGMAPMDLEIPGMVILRVELAWVGGNMEIEEDIEEMADQPSMVEAVFGTDNRISSSLQLLNT